MFNFITIEVLPHFCIMIRIICKNKSYEPYIHTHTLSTKHVQRLEGGWWFSEETSDGIRQTYRCVHRTVVQNDSILEIVSELPTDFIEQPCWLHETLETWTPLRKEEMAILWRVDDLLVLTFPIEQQWLPWMQELVEPAYTIIKETLVANKRGGLDQRLPHQQPSQDSIHPEKPVQPMLKPMVKSPSQMKKQHIPYSETRHAVPRVSPQVSQITLAEERGQQYPRQAIVSATPKAVQTGLLCSPTFLPESRLPRKSPFHQPKRYTHIESTRVNVLEQSACLIDLSAS